jgi:hypothetical protein
MTKQERVRGYAQKHRAKYPEKMMWARAKARAKARGIEFNIEVSDIVIPDLCPISGTPFVVGDHNLAPSLDRIDNKRGYVSGNVIVVQNYWNKLKSNGSVDDFIKLAKFYAKFMN